MSGVPNIPHPKNEPVLGYAPGSAERASLKAALAALSGEVADIPAIVGGKEVRSGDCIDVTSPHRNKHVIARAHLASEATIKAAAKAAVGAQREWAALRFEDRAAVFLRAAELLATTRRMLVNAATMLGQSKTAFQAEIDSACELIDFWRFNPAYAQELYDEQPISSNTMWNQLDYRPLEGFVYA
ncbi:MAG: aldehyde dehydrogenase family protein, partial [Gemmatimonadales bacterium]